jgi:hypothetical protein
LKTWKTAGTVAFRVSTHCFRKIATHWLMIKAGEFVQISSSIRYVTDDA